MSTPLPQLFADLSWHDLWRDAKIEEALQYVRASKRLRLSAEWRKVIPSSLPEDSESEEEY